MKVAPIKQFSAFLFFSFIMMNLSFAQEIFKWPEGKKMALTLSFDDARLSQVDVGVPLFEQYGVKATFVVVPANVEKRLEGWKKVVSDGHEIGNHTLQHPCSGNFPWSRKKALENYTLEKMKKELIATNEEIESLLGVKSTVFAYPCGATFIGRGVQTKSYVPLVAELFAAGRGWLDEGPNDPTFCDLAQLTGVEMDGKDFDQVLPLLENARETGAWLVLAGHEIGDSGAQTTRVAMLKKLIDYAQDPANGIWLAPMGEVARYVKKHRPALNDPKLVLPENNAILLHAKDGIGIGPKIAYMPEWSAFGWFTEKDRVEWDVKVEEKGVYEVYLEWSVSDESAGTPYVFETGEEQLRGEVGKSGSWEIFKNENIGRIKLKPGFQRMVFRGQNTEGDKGLLDLRFIRLVHVE